MLTSLNSKSTSPTLDGDDNVNNTINVGAVQLNSQADVDANLLIIERAIASASAQGVHLLVLPENACVMGDQRTLATRYDELVSWYGNLAKTHGMFIVAGSLPCAYRPDGSAVPNGKVRQVSLLFAPNGNCVARYDKIHLFRAMVADAVGAQSTNYDEGQTFEAGTQTVVTRLDLSLLQDFCNSKTILGLGMMICFDLRFPKLAQRLREAGADILVAPSAFTFATGQAHWHKLLTARAMDAQCLLIGSAQGGKHNMPNGSVRETWGHSAIVNANGETLTKFDHTDVYNHSDSHNNTEDGFALVTTQFNINEQNQWREDLPIFACHRLS